MFNFRCRLCQRIYFNTKLLPIYSTKFPPTNFVGTWINTLDVPWSFWCANFNKEYVVGYKTDTVRSESSPLMVGVHGDIQTTRELLARAVERLDHITGAQQQPPNVQASRTAPNLLITTSSSQGSARSGPENVSI